MAPTQDVPIIAERLDDDSVDRRLLIARWGLVPSWAKDVKIGSKLINGLKRGKWPLRRGVGDEHHAVRRMRRRRVVRDAGGQRLGSGVARCERCERCVSPEFGGA